MDLDATRGKRDLGTVGTKVELAVSKVSGDRVRAWKVDIPASLAGKRQRRFFRTRREAESYAADFLDASLRGGVSSALDGNTVAQAWSRYLESKLSMVGRRQAESLRLHGARVLEILGHYRLSVLTLRDVERYVFREGWSKRTQWNALSYLRTFLRWCQRRDLVSRNVADLLAEEVEKPQSELEILSPDEMALLLKITRRDPLMRVFIVLGGFAGLRSAEIMRIDWADIKTVDGEIHVRRGVIKKTRGMRERFVVINATCAKWLPKSGAGPVVPHTLRAFQRRVEAFLARLRAEVGEDPVGGAKRWQRWPQNCLRHSFASYLLAIRQDAGYVAYQMGHTSANMVYQTYARAVRVQEAKRWWEL